MASVRGVAVQCPSDGESSCSGGSPATTASSRSDTDLDGEEKTCAVCGDRATGYHFHVMTCEGCKGFFRRTVIKGIQFTCPFTRSCTITKAKRRQCQACRYQKCLVAGMRKDMIMSEEALHVRRALRWQKKHQGQSLASVEPPEESSLTEEQEQLIELLTEAHKKTFDSSFSQFNHYQPAVRLYIHSQRSQSPQDAAVPPMCPYSPQDHMESFPEEVLPDVFNLLPLFADISTYMIQQVIQFAKAIPSFRSLPIDDQISLLKGATLEICQIRFNTVFNEETKAWECGQHCYTIQDGALTGFQQVYLEPLLKFHISLKKLRLHEAEYVLLQALVLFYPACDFADHMDVTQREVIDQTQEKIALTLKNYIDQRHALPEGRFLYAKLLLLLTELRTLKVENTRQILHIHDTQDLTTMTPLLSEIIS
ncbi:nuclear receptor subfamily 1 group I member 3 isoform X1 [Podarcis raffonei]|uniref:nuclear receptor subfamily 1 group I member 3 isoform X1 n=1 Tax=Podarcis raffonei TaxID=65483 RepID=UPI002329678B|nr:nuclear receptor subfamily 1 group I member 3 isoform X1 [Podarcis raffonei]XP_053225040.1 nuclear receptor subfamily 1 group I member 3 isoform X1 [Podarcis raffonei]